MRRAHWLRHNKASLYPRRILCLDVESHRNIGEGLEGHRFRMASATFDTYRDGVASRHEQATFTTTADLWDWIDAHCVASHRAVLFAHNLGYDIRVSDALTALTERGWHVEALALDRNRCWLRLKNGRRSLTMQDTVSFFGVSMHKLAEAIQWRYTPLPPDDAGEEWFRARVENDTQLLRECVLRMLRWLQDIDAGNFRLTGSAQGMALFRHRFLNGHQLLVHDDDAQLARERRAGWTGRCEVWRHGYIRGPLYEFDFSLCYARTARDSSLPVRLRGEMQARHTAGESVGRNGSVSLSTVRVNTNTPVVPAAIGDRIAWPIGEFDTVLWDCEIHLAKTAGAKLEIGRTWLYHAEPIMHEWGEWVLGELDEENTRLDPIARTILKSWSRTTVGRFGLRYPMWERMEDARRCGFTISPWKDADTGAKGATLHVGYRVFDRTGNEEGPDSAPAVMSYVMALARCRLWKAMQTLPPDSLVYCDTDSLVVTQDGYEALDAFARTPDGEGLRIKAVHEDATFYAPRQLVLSGQSRIAGVPRGAVPLGDGKFRGKLWESLESSLKRSSTNEVFVTDRLFQITGRDARRLHLPGGQTSALVLPCPDAENGSHELNTTPCKVACGHDE